MTQSPSPADIQLEDAMQDATGGPEVVLRLDGICKSFSGVSANDGISLALHRGEILGLLGENGAGKTTLMNILFGHYVADSGEIAVFGKPLPAGNPAAALTAGIGMVHQHFTLADNLTVLDNIMLGTERLRRWKSDRAAARLKLAQISTQYGLEVNPDVLVGTLSVGEKQRVEILKALYRDVRILILDEPTAVLTPQESLALFRSLAEFAARGLSVILISHRLGEVLAACGRVIVLRGGEIAGERICAAATRVELSELMVGKAMMPPRLAEMPRGGPLLRFKSVSARRDGRGIDSVSLDVHKHEVLGIAGVSGNGQAVLADVACGMLRPAAGEIEITGAGLGRIPEDRHGEGVFGDLSIAENLISENFRSKAYARRGWMKWGSVREHAARQIASFDIKCPSPASRIRLLSGGNMQKVILARALAGAPDVIIANQPTRGLDVGAVGFVHEQLLAARARGAAILLISEDLDEIMGLSDRVSVMHRGALSEPLWRRELNFADLGLMMAGQPRRSVDETHAA